MNTNAVERLHLLLTIFQTAEQYSIAELSSYLKIPAAVLRNDILTLHKNRFLTTTFQPEDEESLAGGGKDFETLLLSGELDEEDLTMWNGTPKGDYFSLTRLEFDCLNLFLQDRNYRVGEVKRNYAVKNLYNQAPPGMRVKAKEYARKIEAGELIKITYENRHGKMTEFTFRPEAVVHDAPEDRYYLVYRENGQIRSLRLDRIRRCETIRVRVSADAGDLSEQLAIKWGMENGPKVHVRLKIRKEGNVQDKIRRDLEQRGSGSARWSEDDEALYYENDVVGMQAFSVWVRSYGSSVLVLEPKALRDKILESARASQRFYLEHPAEGNEEKPNG